jgi:hypothetical protein
METVFVTYAGKRPLTAGAEAQNGWFFSTVNTPPAWRRGFCHKRCRADSQIVHKKLDLSMYILARNLLPPELSKGVDVLEIVLDFVSISC